MSLGNGGSAVRSILDVLDGQTPDFVVNPSALRAGPSSSGGAS